MRVSTGKTRVLLAVVGCVVVIGALVGLRYKSVASAKAVILAAAKGRCPLDVTSYMVNNGGKLSDVCIHTRLSNGQTPNFINPRRPFGMAYAFNCGARPQSFRMALGLPIMDVAAEETTVWVTKRTGRGYKMVTKQNLADIGKIQWTHGGDVLDVELTTPCAWHVVVVKGDNAATKAQEPAIPPYRPYSAYAK